MWKNWAVMCSLHYLTFARPQTRRYKTLSWNTGYISAVRESAIHGFKFYVAITVEHGIHLSSVFRGMLNKEEKGKKVSLSLITTGELCAWVCLCLHWNLCLAVIVVCVCECVYSLREAIRDRGIMMVLMAPIAHPACHWSAALGMRVQG